jgi:hypothetical protein
MDDLKSGELERLEVGVSDNVWWENRQFYIHRKKERGSAKRRQRAAKKMFFSHDAGRHCWSRRIRDCKSDMVIPPELDTARNRDSTLSRTRALAVSSFP